MHSDKGRVYTLNVGWCVGSADDIAASLAGRYTVFADFFAYYLVCSAFSRVDFPQYPGLDHDPVSYSEARSGVPLRIIGIMKMTLLPGEVYAIV